MINVLYFSRQREYRADAGAASLMGDRRRMIEALRALGNLQAGQLPKEMATGRIAGGGMMALFSSHPALESRIAALQSASRDFPPAKLATDTHETRKTSAKKCFDTGTGRRPIALETDCRLAEEPLAVDRMKQEKP